MLFCWRRSNSYVLPGESPRPWRCEVGRRPLPARGWQGRIVAGRSQSRKSPQRRALRSKSATSCVPASQRRPRFLVTRVSRANHGGHGCRGGWRKSRILSSSPLIQMLASSQSAPAPRALQNLPLKLRLLLACQLVADACGQDAPRQLRIGSYRTFVPPTCSPDVQRQVSPSSVWLFAK